MNFNSVLLDSIENELIQNNQATYQKIIPIKDYNPETKRTLDILVEKYGGYVNRYDDKIIIFINQVNLTSKKKATEDEERYIKLKSGKINSVINKLDDRLTVIESKLDKIMDEQNRYVKDTNKSVFNYLNYFRPNENKQEIGRLVNEILNHH